MALAEPGVAPTQARFAAALLDPNVEVAALLADGRSPRRFDVHRNTVLSSLVRALAEGFPSIETLVGHEFFAAMAAVFVRQCPPSHPVLLAYGAGFAGFLEGFGPVSHLPYLGDVARLDGLRRRAWHAADVDPLRLSDFAGGDPGHHGERRLALHPSVAVLGSPLPARSIWAAQNGGGEAIGEGAETALVWRDGNAVRVEAIDPPLLDLLDAARRSLPLATLLQVEDENAATERARAFVIALERGLLVDAGTPAHARPPVPESDLFDAFLPAFPRAPHPPRSFR